MTLRYILCAGILGAFAACKLPVRQAGPPLLSYFTPVTAPDTLLLEVDSGDEPVATGDTIPNEVFFTALDKSLLDQISNVADSAESVVTGRQRFPLNPDFDACLVDIRLSWFQLQTLLLYNRRSKTFTDQITVAEWYGGDGSQLLTGSWLFDYDGNGRKDLVRRTIFHGIIPDETGEIQENIAESAELFLWQKDHFVGKELSDTALVARRFPIRSFW